MLKVKNLISVGSNHLVDLWFQAYNLTDEAYTKLNDYNNTNENPKVVPTWDDLKSYVNGPGRIIFSDSN